MAHASLADWIETRIDEITLAWVEAVRGDPRIQSDSDLSEDGLRDHIPAVIEDICDLLRKGESPSLNNTREGRVHTYVRFRQGFRARELVRELSLLRLVLLERTASKLFGESGNAPLESYIELMRLINLYIDEEMSYAVSVYSEARRPDDETR